MELLAAGIQQGLHFICSEQLLEDGKKFLFFDDFSFEVRMWWIIEDFKGNFGTIIQECILQDKLFQKVQTRCLTFPTNFINKHAYIFLPISFQPFSHDDT